MHIRDFDFELPSGLIAQTPLAERDASRLLVLERSSGRIRHHVFRDLPDLLSPRDLIVVNRSRVIPARLLARRVSRVGSGRSVALSNLMGERGYRSSRTN